MRVKGLKGCDEIRVDVSCRVLHHTLHLSIVEKLPRCPERYTFVGTLPDDFPDVLGDKRAI